MILGDQSEDLIRDRRLAPTRSGQDPRKASNLLKISENDADEPYKPDSVRYNLAIASRRPFL